MFGGGGESRSTSQPSRSWDSLKVNVSAPQGIAASDDARDKAEADLFADAIQVVLRYILHEHHGGRAESYNLFFYHMDGRTIAKALPRWVVSPYFVGYRLAQVNAETTLDIDAEPPARASGNARVER